MSRALAAAVPLILASGLQPAVAFHEAGASGGHLQAEPTRLAAVKATWPSVVTIRPPQNGSGWEYLVNGTPERVHGIGYNAITLGLPAAQRAARLDRDFGRISGAGANTIVGWSESEFDDVLMQKAADHGLGVILPFQLGPAYVNAGPDYAYEDPQVRQQLLAAISRRVEHYRNSPALRMWGLGNEVLHAIAWAHGSKAHSQAFADFLIQAADAVHAIDPNHPVIYRDAEDWYVQPIIQALAANPKPRPWFVYSMNFFTARLDQALQSGPAVSLHLPLMVSEFGPVGLRPQARPDGYRQLWDIVRAHGKQVLGGCAYVWTTAGPEPLDRNFGLTDATGQPVDGSLDELTALYTSD